MMKTPVIVVAVALTAAILLAASLVIATGTRSNAVIGALQERISSPAKAGDPVFPRR